MKFLLKTHTRTLVLKVETTALVDKDFCSFFFVTYYRGVLLLFFLGNENVIGTSNCAVVLTKVNTTTLLDNNGSPIMLSRVALLFVLVVQRKQ